MDENREREMLRAMFDALPSLVFVVDHDVRIQEYNAAASVLMAVERKSVLKRRAGEILHCLHAHDVAEGCGRAPFCEDCMIRNAVKEAFRGNQVVRRRSRIELVRDGNKTEIYALITASPFSFQGETHALLVIEDIREMAELYRMVPICAVCGKVRDDKESWMRVEAYFKSSWDLDFSHGFCPDCFKSEVDKMNAYEKAKQDPPAETGKARC